MLVVGHCLEVAVTVHVGVTVHRHCSPALFTGYCSHPEGQHLTGI
ncbi:hypothetical protein SLEP1_g60263 [Rubroshorea leprosula]|uniref:Uncharacterized protein n=1 Tax=Rubroshorea leprosula TaxID=152421 RepID=A0AAV5MZF3_9ROSI|nr:hypothetical protein SLEP1_g60263 [Rubroshorea leprosula]